jgi:hypothetical protein
MQKGYENFEREISNYCDKSIINETLFSNYKHFEKNIHTYCDSNIGQEILFPAFVNLWDTDVHIDKKYLAIMTSKIISNLLERRILIRVFQKEGAEERPNELSWRYKTDEYGNYFEIPPKNCFEDGYGLYRVQPHEDLVNYSDVIKRKMKMLGRTCD